MSYRQQDAVHQELKQLMNAMSTIMQDEFRDGCLQVPLGQEKLLPNIRYFSRIIRKRLWVNTLLIAKQLRSLTNTRNRVLANTRSL